MGAGQILLVNAEVPFFVLGKFGCGRLFAECNLSSSIGGDRHDQTLMMKQWPMNPMHSFFFWLSQINRWYFCAYKNVLMLEYIFPYSDNFPSRIYFWLDFILFAALFSQFTSINSNPMNPTIHSFIYALKICPHFWIKILAFFLKYFLNSHFNLCTYLLK